MNDGALNRPLESGGRRGFDGVIDFQVIEFVVDIFFESIVEFFETDAAGPHNGRSILIVDQDKKEMFERGIFVVALVGGCQGSVKRAFKIWRK